MALKRLTNKELQEVCKELFYSYMASGKTFYSEGNVQECTKNRPTPMDMLYQQHLDTLDENRARIKMYQEAIEENRDNAQCKEVLEKQLQFLFEEKRIFETTNLAEQKKLYKKTGKVDYSRNSVRIPLDKLINSYYDDLVLEVLFYDDIAVLNGKYNDYRALETVEDRINFIKANTEVTHLGLAYIRNGNHVATIGIQGKLNFDDQRVRESSITLLDSTYSDFENLSLEKTMDISNNDLRQFIQSKIDLDKADMELLAESYIGNDNYRIYRNNLEVKESSSRFSSWDNNDNLYIRYVCPSTSRIYYNALNLRNLSLSDYYVENKPESYIEAWWSITHMGADPKGEAMWRC